jgi:serine/threonine-protein kinase RsbW
MDSDARPESCHRIPAELARLSEVRQFVREAGASAAAPPSVIDDLVQAVDEAATNAIVHGYAGREGWVEVSLRRAGADVVVTVEDGAPPFDPTGVPEPDMTVSALDRGPGGMGIRLIRMATDGLAHRPRPGGGNILTMTRSLAPRPEEDRTMALQTSVEQVDGPTPATVVALDGELDASSFEGVIETVRRVYEGGSRLLVLDLTNLQFISSSGLVALHSAMRIMRGEAPPDLDEGWGAVRAMHHEVEGGAVHANLRAFGTSEAVQKVLDRTGLGALIPTYPDRASALAAV